MKKNILVFPCGSEIALELFRAVGNDIHFNLIGASSVEDHGRFIYKNYIGGIPYISDPTFISALKDIIITNDIDAVYPAMDEVITILKNNEKELGCKVISSPCNTVDICLSKSKTYNLLKAYVLTPIVFTLESINAFPIFAKPDIGYGSRGTKLIQNHNQLIAYADEYPHSIYCELLPGDEYTVDCFTDRHRNLLFWAPRQRKRVMNGISVNTLPVPESERCEFAPIIEKINTVLEFRGAWFVQLKRNVRGELCLLEIASRFGGSSSLFRMKGVNFASLTLWDAFDFNVKIIENNFDVELDRALANVYKLNLTYNNVYVDFDDTLILEGKYVNTLLLSFLYQCINKGVKIILLSRHANNLWESLCNHRLESVFDKVIQIAKEEKKSTYIEDESSIFIDDSYAERLEVWENKHIPVFSIDMVESLMQ